MIRLLVLLAVLLLIAVAIFAMAAGSLDPLLRLTLIVAVIAGIVGLYWADKQRERREREERIERDQRRLSELQASARSGSFQLAVQGSSGIAIMATGVLFFSLATYVTWQQHRWDLVALSAIVAGFFLLVLAAALPGWGKPIVVLTTAGLATPYSSFIPWSKVEGVALQKVSHRGHVVAHLLQLRIPDLPNLVYQFASTYRFLFALRMGKGRQLLQVNLRKSSESPAVVEGITRWLWSASTGRTHYWDPSLSPEAADAFRKLARLQEEKITDDAQAEQLMNRPHDALAKFETARSSLKVIETEVRHRVQRLRWLTYAMLALMLGGLAVSLMRIL